MPPYLIRWPLNGRERKPATSVTKSLSSTGTPPPCRGRRTSLGDHPRCPFGADVDCCCHPPEFHLGPLTKVVRLLGCLSYIYYQDPRYRRHVKPFAPNLTPPKYRLEMGLWAALPYALAFLSFWWTSYLSMPVWAPLVHGVVTGRATVRLFASGF